METWWLSAAEWQAVRLSIVVSLVAVVASLPLGIALGWLLARRDFYGKAIVETTINLPLVLPPVVTGYLLLVALGSKGWIGGWLDRWFDVQFVFDWKGAAVASAVVAFPLVVRAMRISFAAVDPRLEQAARTLGAGPFDTFRNVTLPLARHGIVAGVILAFARSMGEFGATIMLAGNIPGETRTIPLFVYNALESPGGMNEASRVVIFSILIAAAALIGGEILERRGRMRRFVVS
jgi:molybdate transport system permease protein